MKRILGIALILLLGVAVALGLRYDRGYVLIGYGHWTVEMTLAVFVLLLLVGFTLVYFLLRLWHGVRVSPRLMAKHRERAREKKAERALEQGLVAEVEGDFRRAERALASRAEDSATPVVFYLAAAWAAQEQGALDRRDDYLRRALARAPKAAVAIALVQARLQMAAGQGEAALATLRHLRDQAPKNPQVLRLLAELLQQLEDWEGLARLLPELRRRKVLDEMALEALEQRVFSVLIDRYAERGDLDRLHRIWAQMPRELRYQEAVLGRYASALIEGGEGMVVAALLGDAVERAWSARLVYLYGLVSGPDVKQRLKRAEGWRKAHEQDPVLHLTLGRLCMTLQLWGKARGYLETACERGRLPEAHWLLSQVLEQAGEEIGARAVWKEGIKLAAELERRRWLRGEGGEQPGLPIVRPDPLPAVAGKG